MKGFLDNEFSSFRLVIRETFYTMDEVLIGTDFPRTKAPVTRMPFQIVPFSYRCVFKSIHFGLRIQMFAFP